MNTPTHLILAAAVFAKPDRPKVNAAALVGAFLPDFSLYFLFFWYRHVLNVSDAEIFDRLYFSETWQYVFAIDNSVFVWGAVLALGLWLKRGWLAVFAGAGLLHLAFDFPLHHDDGRAHFWPLTRWVFESPVSYWDPRHFGYIVGALEYLLALALLVVLWRRFASWGVRSVLAVAAILPLAPWVIFGLMFGGPGH